MKSITLIALCLLSTPVMACQFDNEDASPEKFFDLAKTVFTAHVTKTKEIELPSDTSSRFVSGVEAEFKIIEVFKGTPPESHKVHDLVFGIGNCSNPILVGIDYLFYLQDNKEQKKSVDEFNYVGRPSGSRVIEPIESVKSKALLKELREHAAGLKKE